MTCRIYIDARSGIIEIEGEESFIRPQLEILLPLIESAGFGTNPDWEKDGTDSITEIASDSSDDRATSSKRTRRGVNRPPKGQSCSARILSLREEGYFKEHQAPAQIVEGLAKKGWTHNGNQVNAAVSNLFNRGEIQRTKVDRAFKYYWDRD